MSLFIAELHKLRRPLVVAVSVALLGFGLTQAGTIQHRASKKPLPSGGALPARTDCGDLHAAAGTECDLAIVADRARFADEQQSLTRAVAFGAATKLSERRAAHGVRTPLGAGVVALGLTSSLPGFVALLLLAAGLVAGEWSGRTIKSVLTAEGDRVKVVRAKALALGAYVVGITVLMWLMLAIAGPVFRAMFPLPTSATAVSLTHLGLPSTLVRAPLTWAAYVAIAMAAALVTRNPIGTIATGLVLFGTAFMLGGSGATDSASLVRWVQQWMHFDKPRGLPAATAVWPTLTHRKWPELIAPALLATITVLGISLGIWHVKKDDVTV